ncbi:LuxR C-terminal-related transcriptional regulator [Allokutzneria albata]|uniref:LuxR family transcriptional regulator, maltose regulon positive regulatory protein n=1 Tax=Allokutzneria albata TaxID=211114 RepID=A0A1G9R645_ALLAB|nr:LuxR C-terminal-related transcriptional regulator [Allokutzneria albata]SDM18693.1 LuxR family transcriptional regulator, maltose regulon positive regulatory protein [Allokutzneria albata]
MPQGKKQCEHNNKNLCESQLPEDIAANGTAAGSVIATKIRVPVLAPTVVDLPRLLAILDELLREPLDGPPVTLVCAPAGAGKTTLLAAWAHRLTERGTHVAWVSLDADDNDVVPLWSAILRALRETGAWGQDGRLARLSPPGEETEAAFLAELVAAFEHLAEPVYLVLDGVHEVSSAAAVRGLNHLLRQLPSALRIVLATRFPPPLILPRLRVEGRLREIGPAELTFTAREARSLLAGHGVELPPGALSLLMERTEGWAAGLRLAALSAAGSEDPAARVAEFTGEDRAMADYLAGEVLADLPGHVRQVLLSTSVCAAFTVDLAVLLSQQENCGQILDHLERTNALITRGGPDGRWYRHHPLLRSHLLAELGKLNPYGRRDLHRTAADWFAETGDPLVALEHGIASADKDLMVQLITKFGLQEVLKGSGDALRPLLDSVPEEVLAQPSVALVGAVTALDRGDVLAADRCVRRVERAVRPPRTQRLRALHAVVLLHRSRFEGGVRDALSAIEDTRAGRTGDVDIDVLAMANRGTAALWLGEHRAARADLARALRLATAENRDAVALHCRIHLAAVAAAEGDLAQMNSEIAFALDFAQERRWSETARCAYLYVLMGTDAYLRLDHERAERLASVAVRLLDERADPTVALSAHLLKAAVAFDTTEDPHGAVAAFRGHWRRFRGAQLAPALIAFAAPLEQRMALRVGEHRWAVEVLERLRRLLRPSAEHALLQAVLHVHRGHLTAARRLLDLILNQRVPAVVSGTMVDAWLLEAQLADRAGNEHRAHEAVSRALALSQPMHALRPFFGAGAQVRDLLVRGSGRFGRYDSFAASVLAAVPASATGASEALTNRELDLLVELPSMRTTEEIADSLFVSVNTIKTHLRGIYRKLGVNQRRDAITAARRRGLL